MKKYINIITLATLALLAATSCQKELTDGNEGSRINSDEIGFSINQSNYWNNNGSGSQTKASYAGEMQLTNDKGETINVSMSMIDGIESASETMIETKGTPISSSNFTTQVTGIGVIGYLGSTASVYVGNSAKFAGGEILTMTSTTHANATYPTHWAPSATYYWPKAGTLDFWAWAPQAAIEAAAGSNGKVKISNFAIANSASPKALSFNYDLLASDATEQPDLIFASKLDATQSSVSAGAAGCVPLDMKHALAAVRFVVTAKNGGTVSNISLVDVSKTGTCSFNGTAFTWTNTTANKSTYTYNFNTTLGKNTPSDFYSETGGKEAATFMMIPQDLGSQKISIKLARDAASAAAEYVGTIPATTITKWEAGKTYVYNIVIDEEVNVTITDEVTSSNVKQGLAVTNTGSTKAYLRATIIANWKDGNGKIMNTVWTPASGTWTVKKPGASSATTADGPGGADTGWILGSDGYYYYKYQVPAGATTVGTLFDTFTPATAPKNAHLEMSIAVQAIQANLLIGTDGNFKTDPYGWKTTGLSMATDAASNFSE